MKLVQLDITQNSFCSVHIVSEMVPHLDGGVQRVLVDFLELGSDVQQIDLGPTHHDSVQSRLVGSTTLAITVKTHTLNFYTSCILN